MPLIQLSWRDRRCRLRLIHLMRLCHSQSLRRHHLSSNFHQKATGSLNPLRHQLSRSYSTQKNPYRLRRRDLEMCLKLYLIRPNYPVQTFLNRPTRLIHHCLYRRRRSLIRLIDHYFHQS
tara:strand:+ start:2167 stop:2526 length:360 start_codon:yes stop_codon:yes gene_type:complete